MEGVAMFMGLVKRYLITTYLIISLITMGFIGILVFEGIMDEGGVEGATTRYVGGSGPGNWSTIQGAIDNASVGDTIRVFAGTYYENVIVNESVTIIGNGTKDTFINGSNTGDVVNISADMVTLTGVTITYSGDNFMSCTDAGIEVFYADDVHFYDINCSNNCIGIFINNSNRFAINDSIISWNQYGIVSFYSNSNNIFNNFCNWNSNTGIILFRSSFNNVDNNMISYNSGYGIDFIFTDSNIIKNNTCCYNNDGMEFYLTTLSTIENNTCNWNDYNGFWVDSSNTNYFVNNTCSNNNEGMNIFDSNYNYFINNTCDANLWDGIYVWTVTNTYFANNTCSNMDRGITISDSSQNTFQWNNFSDNRNGILLEWDCSSNTFFENIIARNTVRGITIESNSNNNLLYHNFIISNSQQARDQCNNDWYYNNEGNYWSDYTGLDNGAGGRVAGDGIGDTNIPHPGPGMDNYPFIEPYGWIYPGIPVLMRPNDIDFDGKYTLKWNETCRCVGYILEEAEEQTFGSPTVIYEGEDLICDIEGKNNGTYYYRIKGYNDYFESDCEYYR
jgi:parallel beta-helix repeat protein